MSIQQTNKLTKQFLKFALASYKMMNEELGRFLMPASLTGSESS